MATQQQKETNNPLSVALLSPTEPSKLEVLGFGSPLSGKMARSKPYRPIASKSAATSAPLTPPISPPTPVGQQIPGDDTESVDTARDPILFPSQESVAAAQGPLFPEHEALIQAHKKSGKAIAREEEYRLWLEFASKAQFQSDVIGLFKRRGAEYMYAQSMAGAERRKQARKKRAAEQAAAAAAAVGKTATPRKKRARAPKTRGVQKAKQASKKPKRSPPQDDFDDDFETPAQASASKAPKTITNRDDVDYASLEDFCPPIATLGNNPKALKTEWRGAGLNLDNDPDRHLLHEAEVNVASTLRLTCAVYLTSKRRIFIQRVICMHRGKEFRKTDAQQACKIDVNKASRLWAAFDKVGWFDKKFFIGKQVQAA